MGGFECTSWLSGVAVGVTYTSCAWRHTRAGDEDKLPPPLRKRFIPSAPVWGKIENRSAILSLFFVNLINTKKMPVDDLKKELVAYIENINDEELLSLLKEDFMFYGKVKDTDITDDLTSKQLKELKTLAEEEETKDTMTLDEFKQATQKWRTK